MLHDLDVGSGGQVSAQVSRFRERAALARDIWAARQEKEQGHGADRATAPSPAPDREAAPSLADRLRGAAQGIDRSVLAEAAARLRADREAEDQHRAEERQRTKELEQEQQKARRDRGHDYGS